MSFVPEEAQQQVEHKLKFYPEVEIEAGANAMNPGPEQLVKMREIIEQKGKPCCINMITEEVKLMEKEAAEDATVETEALQESREEY